MITAAGIFRFRREETDRVVAPVIRQAAIDQRLVVDVRMHRQQLHRGHAEILEIFNRTGAAEPGVSSAQFLRHVRAQFRESLHVHLVDDRAVQRSRPIRAVAAPIEGVVDHHRFRHSPGVIAEIARQIFRFAADDVAEHFVAPS